MSHPLVPPNCPYFKNQNGWHFVIHPYPGEEVLVYIGGNPPMSPEFFQINKPVIAAVANTYWLKERQRLAYLQGEYSQYLLAGDRARAWIKWGGLE